MIDHTNAITALNPTTDDISWQNTNKSITTLKFQKKVVLKILKSQRERVWSRVLQWKKFRKLPQILLKNYNGHVLILKIPSYTSLHIVLKKKYLGSRYLWQHPLKWFLFNLSYKYGILTWLDGISLTEIFSIEINSNYVTKKA